MEDSYAQRRLDGEFELEKRIPPKKITTHNYKSRLWYKKLKAETKICRYCRCALTKDNKSVDHIISRAQGGGNTEDNIQIICTDCNKTKGNYSHKRMLAKLGRPE